jgi:hypothetical protein
MFHRTPVACVEALTADKPKAPFLWGFRRRASVDPAATPAPPDENAFAADAISAGFESFGRAGMQLGGLHRDQQWVGAWGGRC